MSGTNALPEHVAATLNTLCFLTNTGTKPISIECIQVRYMSKVIELIESYDLKYIAQQTAMGTWTNILIYKDDDVCEAFMKLNNTPITEQDHILNGIFFGYGLKESIAYAKKNGENR